MNRLHPRYKKGDKIGNRFLVHQALMGGMGEVYLCLDEKEMALYALKTFQGSSPDLHDIFKQEVAKWIALEKHPNIVQCFWMQTFDNIPFMALQWVAGDESKGTDLRSWLRHGPVSLALALRFTVDIVRGLQHADEKVPGIVHRDLKPDNVLVNQSKQAKITDFGLAMVVQRSGIAAARSDSDGAALAQSMRVGSMVGTPLYMPPEQWRGEPNLDFRADVYAVGCILYELLTGRWLYSGSTVSELRAQHLEALIPPLNGDFPPEVKGILEGCLAKQREDRFEQLDLLLTALTHVYEAQTGESLPEVTAGEFTAFDYNNRGVTFHNLGQHQRAIVDYNRAIQVDSSFAAAYMNRGNSYAVLGQRESAIADYDRALHLDPNDARAYSNRGTSYAALGQHQRAIADYDRALQFDPNYVKAYFNRGNSCGALGQHQRAIADYDRAIQFDPNLALAYNNRGRSFEALGQYQRAIADYDRALQFDPNFAEAYNNRGISYAALGQHQRAMADYDRAIHLDPNYKEAYNNRGISCGQLGQPERAIADFDRVLQFNPNDAAAYMSRGTSYADVGQPERAIADFDRVLQFNPNDATAYNNRGTSYGQLGQPERAIADFDRALHLDPNDATAYLNRGASYGQLGQPERAMADYERALQLDPNLAQAWLNKGAVFGNQGDLAAALPCFEKAAELGAPQGAQYAARARQMLGLAPAQPEVDDMQAAIEAFQQASDADAMRQAAQQYPILRQLIPVIEEVIQQQVPPELKPEYEQRLIWLKRIVEGK